MEIDFIGVRNANLEDAIYEAAFFAKKNLFPRHKNVCITFKLMRKLRANEGIHGDCMDEEDRDFTDNLTRSVLPMADNYQKEANSSWTNTGNYFNDFIMNDAEMCRRVVEGWNQGLAK